MRTWEQNRRAINELWPLMVFKNEEIALWHHDLGGLDQESLYDAIRNVKRNNDTNYPQLKWIRDEYRVLHRLKNFAATKAKSSEPRNPVRIDSASELKMRDDLRTVADMATVDDFQSTVALIADKAAGLQIELATAYRLVRYLTERLGLAQGGNIRGAA